MGNPKYDRVLYGKCGKKVITDVYRVLDAFKSGDPILDHVSKKSLNAGIRGHKSRMADLIDMRDSINEAIALEEQKVGDGYYEPISEVPNDNWEKI